MVNHKAMTQKYANDILSRVEFDRETGEYKKRAAIQAEKELADDAVARRVEELKGRTSMTPGFLQKSSLFGSEG